jgi:hypothetical protein
MNQQNKPHPAITDQAWQHAQKMAAIIGVRPETLLPNNKGFITPGPLDVIAFKQWTGYSTTDLSKLLGISPKMPRAWMATKNPEQYRPIVSCYWWFLLATFGVIDIEPLQPKTQN